MTEHPSPANENHDPFLSADTALTELYRLRRELVAQDITAYPFEKWQRRQSTLSKLDAAIRLCLAKFDG